MNLRILIFYLALLILPLTGRTQSVDGPLKTLTATGTNTYAISEPLPESYSPKERFIVKFTNGNTGAATLNRSSKGAKAIVKPDGSALVSGDILPGAYYLISYNGTAYQILLGGGSGGGGSVAWGDVTDKPNFDSLYWKTYDTTKTITSTYIQMGDSLINVVGESIGGFGQDNVSYCLYPIQVGSLVVHGSSGTWTDNGAGSFTGAGFVSGSIDYSSGCFDITVTTTQTGFTADYIGLSPTHINIDGTRFDRGGSITTAQILGSGSADFRIGSGGLSLGNGAGNFEIRAFHNFDFGFNPQVSAEGNFNDGFGYRPSNFGFYGHHNIVSGKYNIFDVGLGTSVFKIEQATAAYDGTRYITLNLGSDATGDIFRRNSSGYLSRLAMGSALQVLRVNAGGTDIEWAAPSGGGDMLLGTSQTITAGKIFNHGTFSVRNPANTFNYNFLGSAIAADRDVTIPLLSSNDTFVLNNFAATLTNKTIAAGSNTITGLVDANINTHTTTKITTTSKSLLNSSIVYTDQTNTFGDFDNTFRSSRLRVSNPANTFSYLFTGSAISANRTITLPLLSGNDVAVMEAFGQTLTNKTIALGSNTITGTKAQLNTAVTDGDVQYVGDAPTAHTLDGHSNVTITSNSAGELLKWNGSAWINNTPDEANLTDKTSAQSITNKSFGTGTIFNGDVTIVSTKFSFSPSASLSGINIGSVSTGSLPAGIAAGDMLRNSTTNEYLGHNGTSYFTFLNSTTGGVPLGLIPTGQGGGGGLGYSTSLQWNSTGNSLVVRADIRTETGTSYTLVANDEGVTLRFTNSGTITVTLPDALPQHFRCAIENLGTGTVVLSAETTLNSAGNTLTTQYTGCYVEKLASNIWLAMGAL